MLKSKFKKIALTSILTTMLSSSFIIANAESYKVFIDAGHGGRDNGASHNGYVEDVINLQIANKLKNKLINEGLEVEMSRTSDTSLSLSERAAKSNNSDADIFISIHQNASSNPSVNGIETYYLGNRNKALATAVHNSIINSTNANDRSVREANFQVLRENNKVSILLECGFISNPEEETMLNTESYKEKMVDAIYKGILLYFGSVNMNV